MAGLPRSASGSVTPGTGPPLKVGVVSGREGKPPPGWGVGGHTLTAGETTVSPVVPVGTELPRRRMLPTRPRALITEPNKLCSRWKEQGEH